MIELVEEVEQLLEILRRALAAPGAQGQALGKGINSLLALSQVRLQELKVGLGERIEQTPQRQGAKADAPSTSETVLPPVRANSIASRIQKVPVRQEHLSVGKVREVSLEDLERVDEGMN